VGRGGCGEGDETARGRPPPTRRTHSPVGSGPAPRRRRTHRSPPSLRRQDA